MSPILSCQSVSKSYSARPLFRNISLSLDEGQRIGLIGSNGAGKSTLLKIMGGFVEPDQGTVTRRKGLRAAYIPQEEHFAPELTVCDVLAAAVDETIEEHERWALINIIATRIGFADLAQKCGLLSGGWRKRLSIAAQLIKQPDLLLLDEPTNHLDLEGVLWLEKLLLSSNFAFVVVTHDRAFLENVTNRIIELNAAYADGYLSVDGNFSRFLLAHQEYMSAQANLEQALASKVRREVAWLQRGARARQTKAQARIDEAGRLIDELSEVKLRNAQNATVDIDFTASNRKTKQLLVAKHLSKRYGDKMLFDDVSFVLAPGTKLGILGTNGSGKTTLLKIIAGQMAPDKGTLQTADKLKVVVFDQNRQQLNQQSLLKEALCPSGDAVVYQGRSLHVATWAKKFLFRSDQLNMPISYLSGGEQARILIANLMLQPADVLILDEPTNDLDIQSLSVLEDSLQEFPGAVILVSHDRYLLDNLCNVVLALDGLGAARFFAGYLQAEEQMQSMFADPPPAAVKDTKKGSAPADGPPRRKLSTNEKRELENMDSTIEAAEDEVRTLEKRLEDREIASNHVRLQQIMSEVEAAKQKVEGLYRRWQDLQDRAALD